MACFVTLTPMSAYDPNLELNPNSLLTGVVIFVLLGFATVFIIVKTGDPKANAAPVAAPAE